MSKHNSAQRTCVTVVCIGTQEKQVETLRQRSLAAVNGAVPSQHPPAEQRADTVHESECEQHNHAGGAAVPGMTAVHIRGGGGSVSARSVQHQDSGIHRYSQQRPAEVRP